MLYCTVHHAMLCCAEVDCNFRHTFLGLSIHRYLLFVFLLCPMRAWPPTPLSSSSFSSSASHLFWERGGAKKVLHFPLASGIRRFIESVQKGRRGKNGLREGRVQRGTASEMDSVYVCLVCWSLLFFCKNNRTFCCSTEKSRHKTTLSIGRGK